MPHEDASSHRPSNADKQHALRSGRTTRWWHQSTLSSKRVRRTCTSETLRARTMNHHHDARNGLGAAEMPHRVEHIPLFLDLHFGLVQAVNVRTNVGSVAAPAHDPVGPRDAAPGDHIHGVRLSERSSPSWDCRVSWLGPSRPPSTLTRFGLSRLPFVCYNVEAGWQNFTIILFV